MEDKRSREFFFSIRRKYKSEFISIIMTTIFLILIDKLFSPTFMNNSITLTLYLQSFPLRLISEFFSNFVFIFLFSVILLMFLFQKSLKRNLVIIIGVFMLIYSQALLKLIFMDSRPVHKMGSLDSAFCICDYGKPSGHALCTTGLLLFIYQNIRNNYSLTLKQGIFLKIIGSIILWSVCLSRIILGAHSYNQIILGVSFGATIFIIIANYEESILKLLIQPILKKEKLKERATIYGIITMAIFMNHLLLYFWSLRKNYFETLENDFYEFKNCFHCLLDGRHNFSSKIIKDVMLFNVLFGILLGFYLYCGTGPRWRGIFDEKNKKLLFFRLCFFLLFLMPLYLVVGFKLNRSFFEISKNISVSILVGFLISNTFTHLSNWLANREQLRKNPRILIDGTAMDGELENSI